MIEAQKQLGFCEYFDLGAWSFTDDRQILVSRDFTGNDPALARIRGQHGKSLRAPLGVFRQPALPLCVKFRDGRNA